MTTGKVPPEHDLEKLQTFRAKVMLQNRETERNASHSTLALVDDEPDDGYRLQDQVGFVLRKAHQRHVAVFASRIGDLTPPQFAALARLYEIGETSQNQLGQMIAMDAATVKGVIDRLKSRGYVDLKKHDTDKRLLLLSLSAAGREAVEELIPSAKAITEETLAPLTPKEAAQFLRLLGKIA